MLEIFDEAAVSLATRITRMIKIELCYGDGLPSTVCMSCAENLSCASQFIADSLKIDDSLRKVVTFISEVSGPGLEVQDITEETLKLFEMINDNIEHISSVCRLCMTQYRSNEMSRIFADSDNSLEMHLRKLVRLEVPWTSCVSLNFYLVNYVLESKITYLLGNSKFIIS